MRHNLLKDLYINQIKNHELINIFVLVIIWIIMVILVNPYGNFPLNDDWVYGLSVQSIIDKGDFKLSDFSAANLFTQAFWGALFCLPFGFSFTALRFSTLTLGLIGVITTYKLIKEVNINPKSSFFGALLVAENPVYFGLSNTFMTDVPFYTFATLSFYFLIRGLKADSVLNVTLGILFSYVALLDRQLGLAIPLAFGCAYIAKKGLSLKNLTKGFTPTLLGIVIQLSYQGWLYSTKVVPSSSTHNLQIRQIFEAFHHELSFIIFSFNRNTLIALLYLGLFTFPFLIIVLASSVKKLSFRRQRVTFLVLSIFFIMLTMGIFAAKLHQLPLLESILVDIGLGPLTLRDTYILGLNYVQAPMVLKISWVIMTAIGIVGASLLTYYLLFALVHLFNNRQSSNFIDNKWLLALIVSAIFIYFFPLGMLKKSDIYDRYFILLMPLLMMTASVIATSIGNWDFKRMPFSIALIMILLYGGFTIGATHDYLSWNRVRWQALQSLFQDVHISPNHIDGGYEFNGWYLYDFNYKEKPGKSYWWVDRDDYIISFGLLPGYEEVKKYPIHKWLPFSQNNIFVLHKRTV